MVFDSKQALPKSIIFKSCFFELFTQNYKISLKKKNKKNVNFKNKIFSGFKSQCMIFSYSVIISPLSS